MLASSLASLGCTWAMMTSTVVRLVNIEERLENSVGRRESRLER